MTDDLNTQKYSLLKSAISIHDFARKLFQYEHGEGYMHFPLSGSVMTWSSPDFPEQIKQTYLIKALKMLQWIDENGQKS